LRHVDGEALTGDEEIPAADLCSETGCELLEQMACRRARRPREAGVGEDVASLHLSAERPRRAVEGEQPVLLADEILVLSHVTQIAKRNERVKHHFVVLF
jgi:hypothetical protein